MHKLSYLLIALTFFWVACGDSDKESAPAEAAATEAPEDATARSADPEHEATPSSAVAEQAVCLWPQVGLRDKPGRGKEAKYLTGINFGEVVTLTGESEEIKAENRTYIEVSLSDGKTGWVNDYLFAVQSQRAVALKTIDVYKRPELTTFTGKKFEEGDIFALGQSNNPTWAPASGKEKTRDGWVPLTNGTYSTDEVDVTVAIMLDRAMSEKDPRKREDLLNNLASNSTFSSSPLMRLVDEAINKAEAVPELQDNQLMITAENLNVRSEPDNEADNVVFQLNNGDVCTIVEKGAQMEIRDMNDFWYKIEKDGQTGWVYGHFTSKRQ
ncbi:MAG: SH3 domain-containing protein [Bacteroidota bacterium]